MDKVAGFLEVDQTNGTNEIVIRLPDLKPDAHGAVRIVFSARHARHLANLLVEYATYAEAEVNGLPPQSVPYRRLIHDRKSRASK